MAIKTVAQMFGDGAGNGAAVPYSTTNPPGTAAANRGIQFGEQLTAAIANRTHVALCLNDEDLNVRLVFWEVDGLDAAYRLGAVNTPGGGRTVTLDGGPVELQALTVTAQSPNLNANLALNMKAAAASGATGLDVSGVQEDRPYASIVARVTQDLTGIGITDPDSGVLNPASAGVALLDLGTGVDAQNTLIIGVDLIELTTTAYAGFYSFISVSGDQLQLRNLIGTTPSFAADTAVSYRIWRNHFKTGSEISASHAIGGTVIAGGRHLDDTPVLTLVSEARAPLTTTNGGSRYALEVRQLLTGNAGVSTPSFRIDATGTLRGGSIGTPNEDLQFRPAYYHRGATSIAKNVGFASLNTGSSETHGLVVVERRSSLGGHVVNVNGAALTGASSVQVTPGQLLEIITSSHVGVYVVKDCSVPSSWVIATLDGASPAFAVAAVTMYLLEGAYTGRTASFVTPPAQSISDTGVVTDAEEDTLSSVHITTPIHGDTAVAANALLLGMAQDINPTEATYLRCVGRRNEGEDFALLYGGIGWAKGGWQGSRMVSSLYQWNTLRTVVRTQNNQLAFGALWSSDSAGHPVAAADNTILWYPFVELIDGATITTITIPHDTGTARAAVPDRASFQLFKKSAYGSYTAVGSLVTDDGTGTPNTLVTISGLSEVIDLSTYAYFLQIVSGEPFDDEIVGSAKVTMTTRFLQP
jgi:hypothetical protein